MSTFVKTADVPDGIRPTDWSFCSGCYGNQITNDWKTTDASGAICSRCGGSGTLWILDDLDHEEMLP